METHSFMGHTPPHGISPMLIFTDRFALPGYMLVFTPRDCCTIVGRMQQAADRSFTTPSLSFIDLSTLNMWSPATCFASACFCCYGCRHIADELLRVPAGQQHIASGRGVLLRLRRRCHLVRFFLAGEVEPRRPCRGIQCLCQVLLTVRARGT